MVCLSARISGRPGSAYRLPAAPPAVQRGGGLAHYDFRIVYYSCCCNAWFSGGASAEPPAGATESAGASGEVGQSGSPETSATMLLTALFSNLIHLSCAGGYKEQFDKRVGTIGFSGGKLNNLNIQGCDSLYRLPKQPFRQS